MIPVVLCSVLILKGFLRDRGRDEPNLISTSEGFLI